METAFFRFTESAENKDKVYSSSLLSLAGSSVLFLFFVFIFLHPISGAIGYSQHPEYIIWFAWILALDAFSAIPFARLRRQNKARRFTLVKLVNISSNILFNLFFLLLCPYLQRTAGSPVLLQIIDYVYTPSVGVGYVFISNLLASAVTMLFLVPEFRGIKWQFDTALWKRMLLYALPLMLAGLAGMVNETMDRLLLKHLLPDKSSAMEQLGIYGANYKLSIIMTLFIQSFRFAAEPFFFSHSSKENAKQTYADIMKYFVIICSFIFLFIMMYMEFIKYFIGEKFHSGLTVVPVLLLANIALGIFFNLSIWFKLSGQTGFGAYLAVLGAVITLALNYLWIPVMGYMGAAWATLVCYASMAVACYFTGQRYYPVPYDLKRILGYLLLALVLFVASRKIIPRMSSDFTVSILLNTLLLAIFIATAWQIEKKRENKEIIS